MFRPSWTECRYVHWRWNEARRIVLWFINMCVQITENMKRCESNQFLLPRLFSFPFLLHNNPVCNCCCNTLPIFTLFSSSSWWSVYLMFTQRKGIPKFSILFYSGMTTIRACEMIVSMYGRCILPLNRHFSVTYRYMYRGEPKKQE